MGKRIAAGCELTIGLDLGDRFTEGRVRDGAEEVVEAFRVPTREPALSSRLASFPPSRVELEVGTHSPWVSRVVARSGHEGIVANPRRVRLIAGERCRSTRSGSPYAGQLTWHSTFQSASGRARH